jgi:hypothetical protein
MVSRKGSWLSRIKRDVALYVGMTIVTALVGVDIKIDRDIVRLDADQQTSSVAVAKSIDSIPLRVNQGVEVSESSLGNELLSDLSKHPAAMEEIIHVLEAKSAEIQVANEVDCLASHDLLNREIQNFKNAPSVENLNRAIELYGFLVRHCRVQPQAQK